MPVSCLRIAVARAVGHDGFVPEPRLTATHTFAASPPSPASALVSLLLSCGDDGPIGTLGSAPCDLRTRVEFQAAAEDLISQASWAVDARGPNLLDVLDVAPLVVKEEHVV